MLWRPPFVSIPGWCIGSRIRSRAIIMTRKMLLGIKQRAEGFSQLTEIRHDTGTYVAH